MDQMSCDLSDQENYHTNDQTVADIKDDIKEIEQELTKLRLSDIETSLNMSDDLEAKYVTDDINEEGHQKKYEEVSMVDLLYSGNFFLNYGQLRKQNTAQQGSSYLPQIPKRNKHTLQSHSFICRKFVMPLLFTLCLLIVDEGTYQNVNTIDYQEGGFTGENSQPQLFKDSEMKFLQDAI